MTELIISSSVLILVVILLRFFLKGKISLRLQYALWALVLVRLLIPASPFQSPISVMSAIDATTRIQREWAPESAPATVSAEPAAIGSAENLPADVVVHLETNAVTDVHQASFDWAILLRYVWYAGIVLVGACLIFSNICFGIKLRRTRRHLTTDGCKLPVYIVEALPSPCLFGLFRPAVYITTNVADDETTLRHVLAHELTHYRHGDHIWSALRSVCLALHWFNPLVWLAAMLSRRDEELACDEAAIKRLGEAERLDYGRTLISLTCEKRSAMDLLCCATTMTDGKKGIRERIALIAKQPKRLVPALVVLLLVMAVAVGCTFTGAGNKEQETATPVGEGNQEAALIPLTEDEIAYYNEAFKPLLPDGNGGTSVNPISYFFMSYYDRPEDLNLAEFLRYFPSPGGVTDADEFAALCKLKNWPFGTDTPINTLPVPIHKIPAANVNDSLTKYAGITLADLSGVGADELLYLEKYDAYYTYTSDFAAGSFVCTHGEKQGDIIRLYGDGPTLTLKLDGEGFLIVSHQRAEADRTTIFSEGDISITVAAEYADLIYVDALYSDNIFSVIANLYYKPDYTESDIYTAQTCGGWIMSVSSYSVDMPEIQSGNGSEFICRAADQENVYFEEYPMSGVNHFKDHPENDEIYNAIRMSIQVDYGNLSPYNQTPIPDIQAYDGAAPDEVVQNAMDLIRQELQYLTYSCGYSFTDAKITGLTQMNTGSASLTKDIQMWRLEYRLLPEDPGKIELVGGMTMEETGGKSWLTEWGSTGQPYLVLLHDETGGWQRICVTNTDVIFVDYGTPDMLAQYGDVYTAAAMALYQKSLGISTIGQIPDVYTREEEMGHTAVQKVAEILTTQLLDNLKTERDDRTFTITDWKNLSVRADNMYNYWVVTGEVEVRYNGVLSPAGSSDTVPAGEYVLVDLGERILKNENDIYSLSLMTDIPQAALEPPQLTADMSVGIGVLPDYADDEILVFHGYFGLFVYDLTSEQMIFSADLKKAVGTTIIQGSEGASVRVSADGSTIQLYFYPERSEPSRMYKIDTRTGSYEYVDYAPLDTYATISDAVYAGFSNGTLGALTYTVGNHSWRLFSGWDWAE